MQIGRTELHGVPFWFSTAATDKFAAGDVAGLLGNNVLSHFVVTLDVPHRTVYLEAEPALEKERRAKRRGVQAF